MPEGPERPPAAAVRCRVPPIPVAASPGRCSTVWRPSGRVVRGANRSFRSGCRTSSEHRLSAHQQVCVASQSLPGPGGGRIMRWFGQRGCRRLLGRGIVRILLQKLVPSYVADLLRTIPEREFVFPLDAFPLCPFTRKLPSLAWMLSMTRRSASPAVPSGGSTSGGRGPARRPVHRGCPAARSSRAA